MGGFIGRGEGPSIARTHASEDVPVRLRKAKSGGRESVCVVGKFQYEVCSCRLSLPVAGDVFLMSCDFHWLVACVRYL